LVTVNLKLARFCFFVFLFKFFFFPLSLYLYPLTLFPLHIKNTILKLQRLHLLKKKKNLKNACLYRLFNFFSITAGTSGGVLKHENTVVHVDPNAAVAVKTSTGTVIALNNATGNASNPASAGASPAPPASTAEIQSFLNHQAAGHIQQQQQRNAAPQTAANVSGEGYQK
jgi:hypothetical protein